jgi:hypothetical protein
MRLTLKYDKLTETFEILEKEGDEVSVIVGDPYNYENHIELVINFDVDLLMFDTHNPSIEPEV